MQTNKLIAAERPQTYTTYEVTGSGSFPLDMLRYDHAWPVEWEGNMFGREGERTVKLGSYRLPTAGRWQSFGWTVK